MLHNVLFSILLIRYDLGKTKRKYFDILSCCFSLLKKFHINCIIGSFYSIYSCIYAWIFILLYLFFWLFLFFFCPPFWQLKLKIYNFFLPSLQVTCRKGMIFPKCIFLFTCFVKGGKKEGCIIVNVMLPLLKLYQLYNL